MAAKKKAPEPATSDTGEMPATPAPEPKLSAEQRRKQRSEAVKEANRRRLAKLAADKAQRKAAKAAAKAAKPPKPVPDPAKEEARKAKAAAAKEARDAKAKTATDAQKQLAPIAKEVNARLEKAAKMEKDADDHRLAAALQLKTAEEMCQTAGIKFKDWSAEHVKGYSFETVKTLLRVGKSEEPALALEDLRIRNAAANRRLRERQKEELDEARKQMEFAERAAREVGPREHQAVGQLHHGHDDELMEGLAAMKSAFGELRASEQVEFAEWAAKEVGGEFHSPL